MAGFFRVWIKEKKALPHPIPKDHFLLLCHVIFHWLVYLATNSSTNFSSSRNRNALKYPGTVERPISPFPAARVRWLAPLITWSGPTPIGVKASAKSTKVESHGINGKWDGSFGTFGTSDTPLGLWWHRPQTGGIFIDCFQCSRQDFFLQMVWTAKCFLDAVLCRNFCLEHIIQNQKLFQKSQLKVTEVSFLLLEYQPCERTIEGPPFASWHVAETPSDVSGWQAVTLTSAFGT